MLPTTVGVVWIVVVSLLVVVVVTEYLGRVLWDALLRWSLLPIVVPSHPCNLYRPSDVLGLSKPKSSILSPKRRIRRFNETEG